MLIEDFGAREQVSALKGEAQMTPLVAVKVLARNACTDASATASFNSPSLRFWDAQWAISTRDSHSSRITSKSLKKKGRVSLYPERPGASKRHASLLPFSSSFLAPRASGAFQYSAGEHFEVRRANPTTPRAIVGLSSSQVRGGAPFSGSAGLFHPDAQRATRPGGSAGLLAPRKATLLIPGFSPGNSRQPLALLAARSSQPLQSFAGGYNL